MFKYIILAGLLIFSGLAIIYFWVGVPVVHQETTNDQRQITQYQTQQPLNQIVMTVFYFVPSDKDDELATNWQVAVDASLSELKAFHQLQTQGLSQLDYKIYPQPIIGYQASLEYDTSDTNGGNPQGLRRTAQELIQRGLLPENDISNENNTYQTVLIVYQGVGAAASEHVAFLNKAYLTDQPYHDSYGSSFLAHEFYHTLGVPDTYENPDDTPLSFDLMGSGRYQPLRQTYLDQKVLTALGL